MTSMQQYLSNHERTSMWKHKRIWANDGQHMSNHNAANCVYGYEKEIESITPQHDPVGWCATPIALYM